MGNTVCVRIPGVQFECKLHSIQDLIGHFQWSVSSFSKCTMQGSRREREGKKEEREEERGREGEEGRSDGKEGGGEWSWKGRKGKREAEISKT